LLVLETLFQQISTIFGAADSNFG